MASPHSHTYTDPITHTHTHSLTPSTHSDPICGVRGPLRPGTGAILRHPNVDYIHSKQTAPLTLPVIEHVRVYVFEHERLRKVSVCVCVCRPAPFKKWKK